MLFPTGGVGLSGHERRWLLGLPVDLVGMEEAVSLCLHRARCEAGQPLRILTLNPEMAMRAQKDAALAACFAGEALVVPDGTGIVLAGRCRGWRGMTRVPGVDLLVRLVEEAARSALPVFFFGGKPDMAARAAINLELRFPGLVVAGVAQGFLAPAEEEELPARIAETGARIVLAGLGIPRQEIWLHENLARTGAMVGMGVGGSFDVLSGRTKRAPSWMRRFGLEWVYRLTRAPRRWRRLLVLPGFLWRVFGPAPGGERGTGE